MVRPTHKSAGILRSMIKRRTDQPDYSHAVAGMEEFGVALVGLLKEMLRHHGIVVHTIDHRVKTEQSARKKIETADGGYANYAALHDLLGLRITCYFSDEVDRVAAVIDKEFQTDPVKSVNKGEKLGVKEFGYRSVHKVAWMSAGRTTLAEYRRFSNMRFELQIRTVLQHAWAEIEHDLGYKQDTIPEPMSRRFSMLAGVLELVDYEFESLRKELEEYIADADKAAKTGSIDMALDFATLTSLVHHDAKVKAIDEQIANAVSRPLQGTEPDHRYMKYTMNRCRDIGMHTINDLRVELEKWHKHASAFAAAWITQERESERGGRMVAKPSPMPRGVAIFYLWFVIGLTAKSNGLNVSAEVLDLPEAQDTWAKTLNAIGPPPPLPDVEEGEWGGLPRPNIR